MTESLQEPAGSSAKAVQTAVTVTTAVPAGEAGQKRTGGPS